MKRGSGLVKINGKEENKYFSSKSHRILLNQPLVLSARKSEIDIICTVVGGGLSGQAGAIRHGIARALVNFEPDLRKNLKSKGLLTRDSRIVERKNTVKLKLEEAINLAKDNLKKNDFKKSKSVFQADLRVAVIGSTGYTGHEIIRILLKHPKVKIKLLIGNKSKDKYISDIFTSYSHINLPKIKNLKTANFSEIDVIFSCMPSGNLDEIIHLIPNNLVILIYQQIIE